MLDQSLSGSSHHVCGTGDGAVGGTELSSVLLDSPVQCLVPGVSVYLIIKSQQDRGTAGLYLYPVSLLPGAATVPVHLTLLQHQPRGKVGSGGVTGGDGRLPELWTVTPDTLRCGIQHQLVSIIIKE